MLGCRFSYTCHVDCEKAWQPEQLLKALNGNLPEDIRIINAAGVDDAWHARYEPHSKTYQYVFSIGPICPVVGLRHPTALVAKKWTSNGQIAQHKFLSALVGFHDRRRLPAAEIQIKILNSIQQPTIAPSAPPP